MIKYKIQDIPENSFFYGVVYLDDGFIVASPVIPIDNYIKKLFLGWEFRELSAEGEPQKEPPGDILPFLEESRENASALPDIDDDGRVIRATEIYTRLTEFTEKFLTRVLSNLNGGQADGNLSPGQIYDDTGIDYGELNEKARELCRIIRNEDRYLLRIMQYKRAANEEAGDQGQNPSGQVPSGQAASRFLSSRKDYQVSHTVNSLILSVIMGDYLKFSDDQLADLAVAALLHEAGMLHIPPDVYLTDKPLTREERKAIVTHPILGFNILKSLNFPQNIRLAVLEHHERENGSGYPQRLTGDKISLYAKIIAVACSFEAITAARPYKDAKDAHSGILDLLKNEGGRYDETAIRALIYSLSIYPIGSYVLLSNGRKAQVVDVDPEEPRYPIVRILGQSGEVPVKTSPIGLRILRLAPEKEDLEN
ncbi:MAG: HD-GYP domain-containing protein [Spirochaetaceae bacterium]|jgi:HD-GYP domain-containing protein (c-di-GMP phosphodiesterase class II)|nr:HD-GYP domain-containing protein [Spirochaetaceae bacterium]